MLGWLEGIFEWLGDVLRPLLQGTLDNLRRFKWFVVALVGAILAPIKWIIDWLKAAAEFGVAETNKIFEIAQQMNPGEAASMWSSLSQGTSLMNCIVPLDYAVAMGTLLFAYTMPLLLFRLVMWCYARFPKIAGTGSS